MPSAILVRQYQMKIRVFLWLLAQLLKLLSVLLLLPGAVAAIYGETGGVIAFAATSSFSLATGMLLGRLSSEANSFFKISFNKKRAQWYFDCPSSYRVIPYDDRRRETYFSDGLVVIRDLLGALDYSPEITVPEECKKGFELPEIK